MNELDEINIGKESSIDPKWVDGKLGLILRNFGESFSGLEGWEGNLDATIGE